MLLCNHTYNPNKYSRDDVGFYCKCTKCGEETLFEVPTKDEFLRCFGITEDDNDEYSMEDVMDRDDEE